MKGRARAYLRFAARLALAKSDMARRNRRSSAGVWRGPMAKPAAQE